MTSNSRAHPGSDEQRRGAVCGLLAAALFGASAPASKILLGAVPAVLLAGLLYLGAAAGLGAHRLLVPHSNEAHLARNDRIRLAVVVAFGGILAPILMLLGLARVTAVSGSLLLNLEAPFTVVLALVFFREHLGRDGAIATALILAGAVVLKLEPGALGADIKGVSLLASACACWALDNNLTQRLSLRDPFAIVRVKTLAAGVVNTTLGLVATRGQLPDRFYLAGAILLGSLSYGVSVVLDAYALRFVGAAREAAYFATAPFVGALLSMVLLHEPLRAQDVLAMAVMASGVALLLRERHAHSHEHEALEHEHMHVHDEHHQHAHGPSDPVEEPHCHRHQHIPLVHDHPHVSDEHHRHRH